MSEWQIIATALLCSALLVGGPHWRIWVAMVCNFLATMFLATDPMQVAVADLAAAAFLLGAGRRAHIVAFLFACMVPVYAFSALANIPNFTTYTVIDIIGYVQFGVIAYGGGGISYIGRYLGGGRDFVRGVVAFRGFAKGGMAMDDSQGATRVGLVSQEGLK